MEIVEYKYARLKSPYEMIYITTGLNLAYIWHSYQVLLEHRERNEEGSMHRVHAKYSCN